MSRLYVCEYLNGKITCKKVVAEGNEEIANKFAQRRAGGLTAKINTFVVRNGSRIYTVVSFSSKENEGCFVLQSTKPLTLNKNDIEKSLEKAPEELKNVIEKLTGKSLSGNEKKQTTTEENTEESKQESILKYCVGLRV